jgi:16S rRNA (adenine1518-N6/adenine1519-N6)-dimethyltransferase
MQRLGQHFLQDRSVLRAIAEAVAPRPGETIIEIGPGHGELTKELQMANGKWQIIAIEKDVQLAERLREKFADNPEIKFVEGDALKLLPEITINYKLKAKSYALVGNIPYYITGHLLRVVGELRERPARTVLTIQKEVAERICAEPPRMNKLAAIVQFWAEPRILRIVPSSAFRPEPNVDSAVITLEPRRKPISAVRLAEYAEVVRTLFAQPRKTILNNLRAGIEAKQAEDVLERAGVAPTLRPQDLSLADIVCIAEYFAKTHKSPRLR